VKVSTHPAHNNNTGRKTQWFWWCEISVSAFAVCVMSFLRRFSSARTDDLAQIANPGNGPHVMTPTNHTTGLQPARCREW